MERAEKSEERLEKLELELEILVTNQDALLERISELEMMVEITIDNQEKRLKREAQISKKQRGGLWMAICILIGLVVYFEFSKKNVSDFVTGSVLMGLTTCVLTIASGKSELDIKDVVKLLKRDDQASS